MSHSVCYTDRSLHNKPGIETCRRKSCLVKMKRFQYAVAWHFLFTILSKPSTQKHILKKENVNCKISIPVGKRSQGQKCFLKLILTGFQKKNPCISRLMFLVAYFTGGMNLPAFQTFRSLIPPPTSSTVTWCIFLSLGLQSTLSDQFWKVSEECQKWWKSHC